MSEKSESVKTGISTGERPEVSIVVPMYNEEEVVDELHARLRKTLEAMGRPYEIVFVEDGSKDGTFRKLAEIQKRDGLVRIVKLRGNFGQTPALAAGFDHAQGDIVIGMDGDLQHLPEDIPRFIQEMDKGYDIVSGWRADRKDPFISRKLPSKIANWLMAKLSGVNIHDFGTTFKAYKRDVIKEVHLYSELHRFIPVLASRMKVSIKEIPIENVRQKHRKSHYNISRTFEVFFDLVRLTFINKFMERPLKLFGTLGILVDLIGSAILVYLIFLKYAYGLPLLEYRAPLFILSLLLIVLGVLFFILGLLGELIVRFFHESVGAKIYSVDSILQNKREP